jgi:hypothetical protein
MISDRRKAVQAKVEEKKEATKKQKIPKKKYAQKETGTDGVPKAENKRQVKADTKKSRMPRIES